MNKKIISLSLAFVMLLSMSTMAFADVLDLTNIVDSEKNYTWEEFISDFDAFDYVAGNMEDYVIEAPNGSKYFVQQIQDALDNGVESFDDAIEGLEPYEETTETELKVVEVSAINNTKTIVVTLEEAVANAKFDVTFVDEDEEITEIGVESAIADEDNLVYTLVLADLDGKKGTLVVNEVELAIDYSATALTAAINNAKAKATAAKGKAIDSAEAKALLAALEAPVLNAVDVIDEAVTYYATDIDTNKSVINSRARLQAAIARANAEYAEDEQEAAEELQELVDDVNSATNLADLLDALEALEIENAIYNDSGTDKLYFPLAYFDAIEAGAPLVDKAAIQAVVDAVNLAEVTKLVEKAEETMDADDVEAAEGYLELFEEEVAEAFQERLDAVTAAIEEAELIDAVNKAAADAALLTALQALETAELIENVDEDNKEAYFAALETLQEDAEFAFESVEEIQAFVDKVNADELVAVVDALIDAVNVAEDENELEIALKALETAELIENVDEDNKEAYFAALETLQEDEDFAFEKASEIQVFVDGVNLEVAIKAVNDATNAAGIFAALDSEVLDLDNVVERNEEVYALELAAIFEADATFAFETVEDIQAFVDAANATPVGLVNTAKNTTEMRAALENAELELDLAVYNELSSLQKNLLAQGFAKDDTAYANAAEIQGDLDDAVIELLGL